ncbi:MAG: 50S ribosomal protein L29 [Rickettsiella sp.]|nr:50S ribosomal protein L29 [Rickettsiella sp.]
MKTKEMREMTIDALKKEIFLTGREEFNLKFQHATRQLASSHRLKLVRRQLARLLTILNEKIGQKA